MPKILRDVYLSHDFMGSFLSGDKMVQNHDYVTRLYQSLVSSDFKCSFCQDNGQYMSIDQLCTDIERSTVFVVVITNGYLNKVDHLRLHFNAFSFNSISFLFHFIWISCLSSLNLSLLNLYYA